MYISIKKRNGRTESLFVFEFVDEEELGYYCDTITFFAEKAVSDKENAERNVRVTNQLLEELRTMKNRVDGRYATEDFKISGCLFQDEAERYFNALNVVSSLAMNQMVKEYNEMLGHYSQALDAHIQTLKKYNQSLQEGNDVLDKVETLVAEEAGE